MQKKTNQNIIKHMKTLAGTGYCISNSLEEYVMVVKGEIHFNTSGAQLIPTLMGCKDLTMKINWVVMIDLPAGDVQPLSTM